jgi:hypothetical protein
MTLLYACIKELTTMNIYLDINGVLLTKDLRQANHLEEFLISLLEHHKVYWLTTHCKGDENSAIQYLASYLDSKSLELCKKIKPTNWQTLKTEAIDFSQPFLWFDDSILGAEKRELIKQNKLKSWVKVDLESNQNQLRHFSIFVEI